MTRKTYCGNLLWQSGLTLLAHALVTAASAPVAAMVSMFASKYERDVDLSVGLVSGTTLLSIITMPPVIALAMEVL